MRCAGKHLPLMNSEVGGQIVEVPRRPHTFTWQTADESTRFLIPTDQTEAVVSFAQSGKITFFLYSPK